MTELINWQQTDRKVIEDEVRIAKADGVLQQLVNKLMWFHSIDLGDGVVTPGGKSLDLCRLQEEAFLGPVSLSGKTFIDIGAWNGAFSFAARRRGADVTSIDSYTWGNQVFKGYRAFSIARAALGFDDIKDLWADIEEPLPREIQAADIVLFAGVFYHLQDATFGLRNAASLAKECLVVETYVDNTIPPRTMIYYPGSELNKDPTNWWGPHETLIPLY